MMAIEATTTQIFPMLLMKSLIGLKDPMTNRLIRKNCWTAKSKFMVFQIRGRS